jgi:hypothetical protein
LPARPSAVAAGAVVPSPIVPTPTPQQAELPAPQKRAEGQVSPHDIVVSLPPESAPIIVIPVVASPPTLPPLQVPPAAPVQGIAANLIAPIAAAAGAIDPTAAGATTFTTGKDNIYDIQVNYRLHKCHVSNPYPLTAFVEY